MPIVGRIAVSLLCQIRIFLSCSFRTAGFTREHNTGIFGFFPLNIKCNVNGGYHISEFAAKQNGDLSTTSNCGMRDV